VVLCPASAESAQTIRQYSIGNSLTGINFQNYAQAAASRGNTADWGLHLQPGATLDFILQNASNDQTISQPPFGPYGNALSNFTWDAVVVEPFGRALGGANGDLNNVHSFVNLIQPQSPNAQLYIYETWPSKNAADGTLNYHDSWLANYDGTDDDSVRSRNFFDNLMTQLRATNPSLSKPALMIPVGEVLFDLNERMHAGQITGYSDIGSFYGDNIHANSLGWYTSALTWYATIFKDDPHGLSGTPWGVTDPVITAAIQDSVWNTVNANPWTGVPEPASLGLFATVGALGLTARRRRAA